MYSICIVMYTGILAICGKKVQEDYSGIAEVDILETQRTRKWLITNLEKTEVLLNLTSCPHIDGSKIKVHHASQNISETVMTSDMLVFTDWS